LFQTQDVSRADHDSNVRVAKIDKRIEPVAAVWKHGFGGFLSEP
jgi:hypothetical protein